MPQATRLARTLLLMVDIVLPDYEPITTIVCLLSCKYCVVKDEINQPNSHQQIPLSRDQFLISIFPTEQYPFMCMKSSDVIRTWIVSLIFEMSH
jgi:hypothetical protein